MLYSRGCAAVSQTVLVVQLSYETDVTDHSYVCICVCERGTSAFSMIICAVTRPAITSLCLLYPSVRPSVPADCLTPRRYAGVPTSRQLSAQSAVERPQRARLLQYLTCVSKIQQNLWQLQKICDIIQKECHTITHTHTHTLTDSLTDRDIHGERQTRRSQNLLHGVRRDK